MVTTDTPKQIPQPKVVMIKVRDLEPDPSNPQVEDLATFNDLVESIREHGFLETLTVVPMEGGKHRIVAGEHRWKAAMLAGLDEVPCMVKPEWDDDERKIQLVKMNALRGRFDPIKFTRLWNDLSGRYSREELMRRIGMGSKEAELRRLVKQVGDSMPDQMKKDLNARADRIQSVEDLATVVQSLYTKYGGTLPASFVLFAFGGRTHLMVRMSEETFAPIKLLATRCERAQVALDVILSRRASCGCEDCALPESAQEDDKEIDSDRE